MELNQCSQDLIFIESSGFSMWPFVKQRDKLIIKKVTIEDLMVGDTIVYQTDYHIVCHRLVKKIRDRGRCLLYARGDNSNSSPELITKEMLLGKAVGILRDGKMIELTGFRQQFVNQLIILIGPLLSITIKFCKRLLKKQ